MANKNRSIPKFDVKNYEDPFNYKNLINRSHTSVNLNYSTLQTAEHQCKTCFDNSPQPVKEQYYVDILDFSLYTKRPDHEDAVLNRKWLADLRYTFSTPLPYEYYDVKDLVISSQRVFNAMNRIHQESSVSLESLKKKIGGFFTEIKANLSKFVCKMCAWLLYKVFRRLMTKLLVNPQQMDQLAEAEKTGIPLVYLPLHRSHLDYLIITWVNWHFRLRLPHIASGDNLNLSGLGWLLRATGAFFIRRRVQPSDEGGKDALYRAVLHSYIEQLLKNKMPIEFFLEGTRSRFGKALIPKNGLISNVVEAVQQGIIEDCYLVPVSYTYDAVMEGIFSNELMGVPKVRESMFGILWGVFENLFKSKQCGAVRLHYGKPVRLTSYLSSLSEAIRKKSTTRATLTRLPYSFSYRELVPWHREHSSQADNRAIIRSVGFHVVFEAQNMMSASLVSIVSALMLSFFRNGVSMIRLENESEWLCQEYVSKEGDVMGYEPGVTSGRAIVEYALPFLKGALVDAIPDAYKIVNTHQQLVHLAYFKNRVAAKFSIDSAVALALTCNKKPNVSRDQCFCDALSVCDWLQFDFLFCRPCEELGVLLKKSVSRFRKNGYICYEPAAPYVGDDDDDPILTIKDFESSRLLFFANLLRPFLQSLYIVSLDSSLLEEEMPESQYIRQLCNKSLQNVKEYPFYVYLESINSDSFKNALKILRLKKLLDPDETKVKRTTQSNFIDILQNLKRVLRE